MRSCYTLIITLVATPPRTLSADAEHHVSPALSVNDERKDSHAHDGMWIRTSVVAKVNIL